MTNAKAEMSFWDHLEALRWVLVRVVATWLVLAVAYFIAMPYLFDKVILAPCHDDFIFYEWLRGIAGRVHLDNDFFTQPFEVKLININLTAPFFIHMSTSFVMAVVTTVPYLFFEIWGFIRPALYPKEQRGVQKALLLGSVMFFIGAAVGYFMVFPLTLRFLYQYSLSATIESSLSINSYIDNFLTLVLCMGVAFELPLVTWLLSLMGIVTKSLLRKLRRYAVVLILVAASVITPTSDPFSLAMVAIPLYLLYELSIFMVKDKKPLEEEEAQDEAVTEKE